MVTLKKKIKTPLTNFDIEDKYGISQKNIIRYSELKNIEDLSDEILKNDKTFKILLFEYKANQGHWVLILRYGNVIEFFNSYGLKHSEDDFIDNDELNGYLGQYRLFLDDLLKREQVQQEFDVIYNKVKLQRKHKDVNTCGRHVVLRIICMLYYDMDLKQYLKFMHKTSKITNMDYDEIVATIIS